MILITGASGFIGTALVNRLSTENGFNGIVAAIRNPAVKKIGNAKLVYVSDLSPSTDWHNALHGVSAVVHCAAKVHVMNQTAVDSLEHYRKINVQGTLNLAHQASEAGVKRFVFLSSIKVNGESTILGHPFTADDVPAPQDPYGISKFEAEQGLRELCANTAMELVIVRPPLVYGMGVKANFESMMRWISIGVPLPLGAIHNVRSLVALDNLVDLLVVSLKHPAAIGQTFLVSDGEDVSTTDLLKRTAMAMGKSARLFSVPCCWLEFYATLLGKKNMAQRLCSTLQVDIEKTCRLLHWRPPLSLDEGLKLAVQGVKT